MVNNARLGRTDAILAATETEQKQTYEMDRCMIYSSFVSTVRQMHDEMAV